MKQYEFLKETHIDEKLAMAVIRQLGGWDQFKEYAIDITNHGIDSGFGKFVYYTDTCKFFKNNRKSIIALAENMASDLGEDVFTMIKSFNCMKSISVSENEIAKAIYTGKGELVDQIENCLAWYAGEEVARSYNDMINL